MIAIVIIRLVAILVEKPESVCFCLRFCKAGDVGVTTYEPSPSTSSHFGQRNLHFPTILLWYARSSHVDGIDRQGYPAQSLQLIVPLSGCLVDGQSFSPASLYRKGVAVSALDVGHGCCLGHRYSVLRIELCGHPTASVVSALCCRRL